MKEYKYDNATIRITIPTKQQVENIRKATEIFVKKIVKEGPVKDEWYRKSD